MTTLIFTKLLVSFLWEILASISIIGGAKTLLILFERSACYYCTISSKVEEMNIKA